MIKTIIRRITLVPPLAAISPLIVAIDWLSSRSQTISGSLRSVAGCIRDEWEGEA